jgi:hypothetical protein
MPTGPVAFLLKNLPAVQNAPVNRSVLIGLDEAWIAEDNEDLRLIKDRAFRRSGAGRAPFSFPTEPN